VFFDRNKLVTALYSLSLELGFEPFVALSVVSAQTTLVIFHLVYHQGVKARGDFVSCRGGDCKPDRFWLSSAVGSSQSGHSASQEEKCDAVDHFDRFRPSSLNKGKAMVSTPGIWVTSTPNSL
jgi:hypothetical protein